MPLEDFDIGQKLGSGGFGSVYKARNRLSSELVALKVIDRHRLAKDYEKLCQRVMSEISIHSRLNHKNIIKLFGVFEDDIGIYFVTEICLYGNLYKYLQKTEHVCLSELKTRFIIAQILDSTNYLHRNRIIHRDIKLSNVLIAHITSDGNLVVKLCDFGLAVNLEHPDDEHYTFCGTPHYIPPEIAQFSPDSTKKWNLIKIPNSAQGYSVDIWSVGILTCAILLGQFPEVYRNEFIENPQKFIDHCVNLLTLSHVSSLAIDFITGMLHFDPNRRPTAAAALCHPFFRDLDDTGNQESLETTVPSIVVNLEPKFSNLKEDLKSNTVSSDENIETNEGSEIEDENDQNSKSIVLKNNSTSTSHTWKSRLSELKQSLASVSDAKPLNSLMTSSKSKLKLLFHELRQSIASLRSELPLIDIDEDHCIVAYIRSEFEMVLFLDKVILSKIGCELQYSHDLSKMDIDSSSQMACLQLHLMKNHESLEIAFLDSSIMPSYVKWLNEVVNGGYWKSNEIQSSQLPSVEDDEPFSTFYEPDLDDIDLEKDPMGSDWDLLRQIIDPQSERRHLLTRMGYSVHTQSKEQCHEKQELLIDFIERIITSCTEKCLISFNSYELLVNNVWDKPLYHKLFQSEREREREREREEPSNLQQWLFGVLQQYFVYSVGCVACRIPKVIIYGKIPNHVENNKKPSNHEKFQVFCKCCLMSDEPLPTVVCQYQDFIIVHYNLSTGYLKAVFFPFHDKEQRFNGSVVWEGCMGGNQNDRSSLLVEEEIMIPSEIINHVMITQHLASQCIQYLDSFRNSESMSSISNQWNNSNHSSNSSVATSSTGCTSHSSSTTMFSESSSFPLITTSILEMEKYNLS